MKTFLAVNPEVYIRKKGKGGEKYVAQVAKPGICVGVCSE